MSRKLWILVGLGCLAVVLFPPWRYDGFPVKQSFLFAPDRLPLSSINWLLLAQSLIAVLCVGAALGKMASGGQTGDSGRRKFPGFTWRTLGAASLVALVTPIVVSGGRELIVSPPLAMMPLRIYVDSDHGAPMIFFLTMAWLFLTAVIYVVLAGFGAIRRRLK